MKVSTILLIGVLSIFLNSSLSFAASTYLFGDEHCSTLTGTKWTPLGQNCPKGETLYSLKDSLGLFCQYRLQAGDSLKAALNKNHFYRSKDRVHVIPFSTGEASKVVSSHIEYLLLSKRDLLSKNSSLCKTPRPRTLKSSAFVLHIPNSIYVLKSGLKKINEPALMIAKEDIKPPAVAQEQIKHGNAKKHRGAFQLKTILFFEQFKGTQTSNGTSASISSKLSPGLKLSYNIREDKKFRYEFFAGIDFHIFTERADQLFIANNNVQSIKLGSSVKLTHFKYFAPKLSVSLFEDLYYVRQSSTSLGIERELVPRISLSSEFYLYKRGALIVSIEPTFIYDFARTALQSGTGYHAPISFTLMKGSYLWGLGLDYMSTTKNLTDLELRRKFITASANMRLKF